MELVRHGRVCKEQKEQICEIYHIQRFIIFIIVLLIIFNSDKENINYAIANNTKR